MSEEANNGSFADRLRDDATANRIGNRLEQFRPFLMSVAGNHIFKRHLDRSDIVQETLVSALRNWSNFRGTTEREFATWLRQILIRRSVDLLRQRDASAERKADWARQKGATGVANGAGGAASPSSCPGQVSVKRETVQQVREAVEQLPPDYRHIIMLRHFQGLSLPEAASRMGRSCDSAEKLWARGLTKLRQLLKDVQPPATK